MGRLPKDHDATDESLSKGRSMGMDEIGDPGPIEQAAEVDLKSVELEAFMQDVLTVIVHSDGNDNAVEHPLPGVNGVNQGFIRGKEQKVKRKYVEALARCRVTKYDQQVDMNRPDNIKMVERMALVYPFSVLHDPSPRGRAWLESILAQP